MTIFSQSILRLFLYVQFGDAPVFLKNIFKLNSWCSKKKKKTLFKKEDEFCFPALKLAFCLSKNTNRFSLYILS